LQGLKRASLLFLFFFSVFTEVFAQLEQGETPGDTVHNWVLSGNFRSTFSQVYLNNWVAGGQSSYSSVSLLDLVLRYSKLKAQWDNRLELGYGFQNRKQDGFIKTDDKIEFVSNYSYQAYREFNYSALLNFRSQFAPGYIFSGDERIQISDWLAPAYLIGSLGMNLKREKFFTINLSPFAGRLTIVNHPELSAAGAFGVQPGRIFREEFGAYFKGMFRIENLFENVTVQTRIDLFSNYLEKPQNIDVSWETLFVLKVNKYIQANISTHLIYDHDILIQQDTTGDGIIDSAGPRTQFKEVLSLGLGFKF
jgi:hypothetical protein